jgi:hypothetical protein
LAIGTYTDCTYDINITSGLIFAIYFTPLKKTYAALVAPPGQSNGDATIGLSSFASSILGTMGDSSLSASSSATVGHASLPPSALAPSRATAQKSNNQMVSTTTAKKDSHQIKDTLNQTHVHTHVNQVSPF